MSTTLGRGSRGNGALALRVVVLRRWLLSGVALLAVLLVTFALYERSRTQHLLADIPRRLGLDIRSETNGFTYTQSVKGRVLFTVHAAKAIQRDNGKTTLHDVSIVLHPAAGLEGEDSIRGEQFEYDQANGIIRAVGEVHLNLVAPSTAHLDSPNKPMRIAVTTRGLIFLQKLGVVATNEPLQIVYGDMHGSAHGADYETDTGLLHLRSDVAIVGVKDGKPLRISAGAAELDRVQQTAILRAAELQIATVHAKGDRMFLTFSSGQALQNFKAEGHVTLDDSTGEHLAADHLLASANNSGRLQQIAAQGGVAITAEQYFATAGKALLHIDSANQPVQVELTSEVHVGLGGRVGQGESELTAPHASFNLLSVDGHTQLKDLTADGGAVVSSIQTRDINLNLERSPEKVTRKTILSARLLHASTVAANGIRYISRLDGQGQTSIEQSDSHGNRSISSGDTLQAVFLPSVSASDAARVQPLLRSVAQSGHVEVYQHKVLVSAQRSRSSGLQEENDHATAQHAEWDNVSGQLSLTGSPVLSGPGVQVAADTIYLSQSSSSAEAAGHVRGTLQRTEASNSDTAHVTAEHCRIQSDTGSAQFDGTTSLVRLWTSTVQLEAAQIEVKRPEALLIAKSTVQTDVRLTLGEERSGLPTKINQHGSIRVYGRQMTIAGTGGQSSAQIETSGEVRLSMSGGDLQAEHLVATLERSHIAGVAAPDQPTSASGFMPGAGSSLQSVVASGNVRLQQPGRSAQGQELQYTAKNDEYRMIGSKIQPAVLHDNIRGDVTGSSVVFHSTSERAEIVGGYSKGVRTVIPAPSMRSH